MTEIKTTTRAPFAVRSGHSAYACFTVFTTKSAVTVEISKAFHGGKCRVRMARSMAGHAGTGLQGRRTCRGLLAAGPRGPKVGNSSPSISFGSFLQRCSLQRSLQNLRARQKMSWPPRPPSSLFESECRTIPQQGGMADALQLKKQITLHSGDNVMEYTVLAVGGEDLLEGVLRF